MLKKFSVKNISLKIIRGIFLCMRSTNYIGESAFTITLTDKASVNTGSGLVDSKLSR